MYKLMETIVSEVRGYFSDWVDKIMRIAALRQRVRLGIDSVFSLVGMYALIAWGAILAFPPELEGKWPWHCLISMACSALIIRILFVDRKNGVGVCASALFTLANIWIFLDILVWTINWNRSNIAAISYVLFGFCGILILYVFDNDDAKRTGFLSALVLVCFTQVGIFADTNELSRAFGFLNIFDHKGPFIPSVQYQWEAVALAATAFMALIYLDMIEDIAGGLRGSNGFLGINTVTLLLISSIFFIFFAIAKLHNMYWHFGLIIAVSFCFLLVDRFVWKRLAGAPEQRHKDISSEARLLYRLIDIPVLVALSVMIGLFLNLGCPGEYEQLEKLKHLSEISKYNCEKAFPLLAGALAFQMISFNSMYVSFQIFGKD